MEDLEIAIPYFQNRPANKRMKKRKQLDALLKSRFSSSRASRNSNSNILTSEEELFLSPDKSKSKKIYSIQSRRWWNYVRHIISFCFVCVFMIVCVGLGYANMELKVEIHNLSQRVTEIEKKFSSAEIKNILSTIDQIKIRLDKIERWNSSELNDRFHRLQKNLNQLENQEPSTEMSMSNANEDEDLVFKLKNIEQNSRDFTDVTEALKQLNDDEQQIRNAVWFRDFYSLNKTFFSYVSRWEREFDSLKNHVDVSDQAEKIQQLTDHLTSLTNFMHNSSIQSNTLLGNLRLELNQLRAQIDRCPCSKPTDFNTSPKSSNNLLEEIVNHNSTTFS